MRRRSLLTTLGGALLFGAASNRGNAQSGGTPVINIAAPPIDSAAEPYFAEDMNFFKKAGLTVKLQGLSNGPAIAAGVVSGSIDVGTGSAVSLAVAHQRGLPLVILYPGAINVPSEPTTALMVRKDSTITTAKQLEGKIVAVQTTVGIATLAAYEWLTANGADPKAVHFIEVPTSELASALEGRRVDGILAIEPSLTAAKSVARVLADVYRTLPAGFATTVWFVSRPWADAHPDIVAKLLDAARQTAQWANTHQRESTEILRKYAKISPEIARTMSRSRYATQFNAGMIQPNIDLAARYGLLKATFPAAEIMYQPSAT
jgi:NitT/TauT family transport system substrate-binding protein